MWSSSEPSFKRKILSVIGGFLITFVLGSLYITGNISLYMASHLHYHGEDITLKTLSILLPIQIVGSTSSFYLGV